MKFVVGSKVLARILYEEIRNAREKFDGECGEAIAWQGIMVNDRRDDPRISGTGKDSVAV